MLDAVAALIRATAHTGEAPADPDTHILLDADLAVLAAPEARYRRYAEGIRREYAWVDDDAYRAGRARVLESFLQRGRIYRTEPMAAAGEEPARANLGAELRRLAGSAEPGAV